MGWEETLAERTNVFVMEDEYQAIEADTESEADDKPLSSQSQANLAVPPPNKTPPATTKLPSLEVVAKNKVAVVEEDIGTLKNFAEDADEKDRSTQIEPVLDPPSSADAAAAEERKVIFDWGFEWNSNVDYAISDTRGSSRRSKSNCGHISATSDCCDSPRYEEPRA